MGQLESLRELSIAQSDRKRKKRKKERRKKKRIKLLLLCFGYSI
jgi:hypothetical protein